MPYLQTVTAVHQIVGPWAKFSLQREILILASLSLRKVIQEYVKPILSPFDKSTKLTKFSYGNLSTVHENRTKYLSKRHLK